jgi:hypothetical protein
VVKLQFEQGLDRFGGLRALAAWNVLEQCHGAEEASVDVASWRSVFLLSALEALPPVLGAVDGRSTPVQPLK